MSGPQLIQMRLHCQMILAGMNLAIIREQIGSRPAEKHGCSESLNSIPNMPIYSYNLFPSR